MRQRCLLSSPPLPPRAGSGYQLGPRRGKVIRKFCPLEEGTFREEVTGTPEATVLQVYNQLSGSAPPAQLGLPLQIAPPSTGARLCPRGGRSWGGSQGRGHLLCWPKPTSVQNALNKPSAASRVAGCNWNNKCDARKLPTSRCYAIVCRPRTLGSAWEDREPPEAAGERLGPRCSKHAADFPYYHPNTISHKAITTQKSMKMCLSKSQSPQ